MNKKNNFNPTKVLLEIAEEINDDELYTSLIMESSHYLPEYHDNMLAAVRVALIHLLKIAYQPEKQSSSWINSITQSYQKSYNILVRNNKLVDKEYKKLTEKFDEIAKNSISYAAEEMGKPEDDIKLTYGMSARAFLSKEWLIYFMDTLLQKEPLRTETLNANSKFMKMCNSLSNIDKYDLNKINKELGEPEIYA